MPGAHIPAGDRQTLTARQKRLLQLHRAFGSALAAIELSQERRAMRKLQGVPSGVRVELERTVVPVGCFSKLTVANEQRPCHRTVCGCVVGVDCERTLNGGDAFV